MTLSFITPMELWKWASQAHGWAREAHRRKIQKPRSKLQIVMKHQLQIGSCGTIVKRNSGMRQSQGSSDSEQTRASSCPRWTRSHKSLRIVLRSTLNSRARAETLADAGERRSW